MLPAGETAEDQVTDSDAAANSRVDVHVDGDSDEQQQTHFDPLISDNLIAMLLAQAQQDLTLNMATARNLMANAGASLTLGVQQTAAATIIQMFKMSPAEAQALGMLPPTTP